MHIKSSLPCADTTSKRGERFLKRSVKVAILGILTACGDASQVDDALKLEPSPFRTEAKEGRNSSQVRLFSELEPSPMASYFLRFSEHPETSKLILEDINWASSFGDLSEHIVESAQTLGLVGDFEHMTFANDSGALAPGLHWSQLKPVRPLFFTTGENPEIVSGLSELQLSLDGIPIHNARIKSIVEGGNITWLTGSKPSWLASQVRPKTTAFALNLSEIRQILSSNLGFPQWRFHSPERVYVSESNLARAAYLFTVSAEFKSDETGPAFPLEVAIDADVGHILWQRPLTMHATNSAQIFVENKATSSRLETVMLPDLTNDAILEHQLFNVFNCQRKPRYLEDGTGRICKSIEASNGEFSFAYSDDRYDGVVAFAAITRAMAKFKSWDIAALREDWDQSKWPGTRANFGLEAAGSSGGSERRLSVFVSTETQSATISKCGRDTTPDNAQYLWSGPTGRGNPEILIGYGGYGIESCGSLRELGKDMDVVMHEFGHHIVFRGLSNSKQQSVILHEGLSDYLTYAVTGNNLLAENSKPGAPALRSGNISRPGTTFSKFKEKSGGGFISVTDSLNNPHAVGEFWSAILWEMRQALGKNGSGEFKMDRIVWDSIDLLKSDGGLIDGVSSILESAKRYGERYGEDPLALQKVVQDIFVKYEFGGYNSNGEFYPTDAVTGGSSTSEPGPTTSKKKRWGCGVLHFEQRNIEKEAGPRSSFLFTFVILTLPSGLLSLSQFKKRIRRRVVIPSRKELDTN